MATSLAAEIVPALQDNMDGQRGVLRWEANNPSLRILRHEIDRREFRQGSGSEHVTFHYPAGSSTPLAYRIPPAAVINELRLVAKIRSNRPGVRIGATVMLPRSIDPATGKPLTILVRGKALGQGGDWEPLVLERLSGAIARRVRVSQMQLGRSIDQRGALVTELLLLVPGGRGATELWVDQIELFGLVTSRTQASDQKNQNLIGSSWPKPPKPPASANRSRPTRRPAVPRIIQWQGEPLELLARLGFNMIGMGRSPTADELAEADRHDLQIVCPPPSPQQIQAEGIGANFAAVAAWDLGQQLSPEDLDHAVRWLQLVRRHDPLEARPTLMAPRMHTRGASRIADLLLIGRGVLGTSLSTGDYATWLHGRQRLARPGTPIWTEIETQFSPQQARLIAALRGKPMETHAASYRQLTTLTSAAFGVRSRGFYFRSHTSLVGEGPIARRRALALELTCMRLQLADAWLATGKLGSAARSNNAKLSGLVLQAERSHLLVPMRWSDNTRTATSNEGPVSLLVPGVPESSEAYLLTACGAQRLRQKRVTGGIRVSLDHQLTDEFILLTDDTRAFSQITQYLRRQAPRAAKLRRELVALHLEATGRIANELAQHRGKNALAQQKWNQAKGFLEQCDRFLASKQFERAYQQAGRVALALGQAEQALVEASLDTDNSSLATLVANPLRGSLATLGDYLQLEGALARSPAGQNLLAGGGFEDLASLMDSGWKHQHLALQGVTSAVRLSPEAPRSGSYCLELEALPTDPNLPPGILPTSPAWVVSVPVPVRAGDLVEITGMVRVEQTPMGTVDGLKIFDSLGGPDLAIRVTQAPSWRPFRMVRAATNDTAVTVTIALTGLGVAQVDDLAIRALRRTIPRRAIPQRAVSSSTTAPRR